VYSWDNLDPTSDIFFWSSILISKALEPGWGQLTVDVQKLGFKSRTYCKQYGDPLACSSSAN
jgi:uncharacterized membrane-anchored protein